MSNGSAPSPRPHRRALALVAVLGALLLAVAAGFGIYRLATPSDEEAKVALQVLFERRYDARAARDLDAFMSTVDPRRGFLRDCERQGFERFVRGGKPPPRSSVGSVEKWSGYFRAWLDTEDGWHRVYARYDGGRWYLSEPLPSELGDHLIKEYAGVKVHYLAGESDLAHVVGEDLAAIMARVLPHAAEPPSRIFDLQIATLTDPGGDCFVAGGAERVGTTIVYLNDVRLSSARDHISPSTVTTLEHEALHWLQQEHASRTKTRRLPHWWMIEGWPTFITETPTPSERRIATCTSPPSYDDVSRGLPNGAKPEDVNRAYVIAAMLVERVSGPNDAAYWRFFDDFGGTAEPYLRATGSDGRTFYTKWLEEARRQYC